jgi:hypothetical protein
MMTRISDRYSAPLFLADAGGAVTREIGEVPAFEPAPLGRVTSLAISRDFVYVGTKDSAFVDAYNTVGEHFATLPVGVGRRASTMDHFERAIDEIVLGLGSVTDREAPKELLLQRPMPEYLPPYATLLTDQSGLLWVQLSFPGDPATRLRVVRSDGRVAADVRLPRFVSVYEVGRDYILGAYEDDRGEAYVAIYRLHRG